MKYVRISLVLTCICLLCALAVAGVNYITAPVIEKNELAAKMAAYEKIFPEFNADNSEFIEEGFKSSMVKDKLVARDSDNNDLGFGFQVAGRNQYGPITLVLGIDPEGKLIDIIITENGQTGGRNTMINDYVEESFTTGMTLDEITNTPNYSGATYGSKLVKDLIAAAYAETGIMTEIQKKLIEYFGESVDMGKSVEDTEFIYAQQINIGYEVKDGSGAVLGYYYDINIVNRYGNIRLDVALNSDYTLKNVVVTEMKQTGGRDEMLAGYEDKFTPGMAVDEINNVGAIAGATYGSESIKAGISVAMAEAQNKWDEKLAIKVLYPTYTKYEAVDKTVDGVDKYIKVYGNDKEGKEIVIGSAVIALSENSYGSIKLLVGIDSANKLIGMFIVEANQTAGRNSSLSQFVGKSFTRGMTGEEAVSVPNYAGASFASKTTKEIIAISFEQVTGSRPEVGYDEQYQSLFNGVDLSKSKDIEEFSEPTNDGSFVEGKELYNAEGTLLGYAYILDSTPNELDGTLKVMVGVQPNGKLQKAIILENNQTGGYGDKLNGYEDNFTPGMGATDIGNVANSGATLGSEQFKALLVMALKEVGGYEEFYKKAFPEMDSSKTVFVEAKDIKHKEISEIAKIFDSEGNELGKGYIVRVENVYSWHIFMVALDTNGNLVAVLDVENDHHGSSNDISEQLKLFTKGMTYEEVANVKYDAVGHASFTIEQIRLGIKLAMAENGHEDGTLEEEILLKETFPNIVFDRSDRITSEFKNKGIVYGYKVVGTEGYNNVASHIGYAYFMEIENKDIVLHIMIGVDLNGNYVNAVLVDMETKVVINPADGVFGDTLEARVKEYLSSFKKGMTERDVINLSLYETAGYASQLVKYGIRLAMNEAQGKTLNKVNLYLNNEFYINNIENVDLVESTKLEIKNTNYIKEAILAKDSEGNNLAYAYIVELLGIYSHNYILVVLNTDGTLNKIYDIENNHGALANFIGMFENGMSFADIENLKDTTGHGSFTLEQAKLAVKIAMTENKSLDNNVKYETASKEIFPYMVMDRSQDITSLIVDTTNIKYGLRVYGTKNYVNASLLGFTFVVNNSGKNAMIGVNTEFMVEGVYDLDTNKLVSKEELSNYQALIDIAIKEAKLHVKNVKYDKNVRDVFNNYYPEKSNVIEIKNKTNILFAVEVKDINGSYLGHFYVSRVENQYSWHEFGVALDNNGNLIQVTDIANDHHGSSNDISEQLKVFTKGMSYEAVSNVKFDAVSHATYTIEQIRLGIKLAMVEFSSKSDSNLEFEIALKTLNNKAIWDRSKKLENLDANITFGLEVFGTYAYENAAKSIGYAFVVEVDSKKVMVSFDEIGDNHFEPSLKISLYDLNTKTVVEDTAGYENVMKIAQAQYDKLKGGNN